MSEDFRMGLAQDDHDHPWCNSCGERTLRGDLVEVAGDEVCGDCADTLTAERDEHDPDL